MSRKRGAAGEVEMKGEDAEVEGEKANHFTDYDVTDYDLRITDYDLQCFHLCTPKLLTTRLSITSTLL